MPLDPSVDYEHLPPGDAFDETDVDNFSVLLLAVDDTQIVIIAVDRTGVANLAPGLRIKRGLI